MNNKNYEHEKKNIPYFICGVCFFAGSGYRCKKDTTASVDLSTCDPAAPIIGSNWNLSGCYAGQYATEAQAAADNLQ